MNKLTLPICPEDSVVITDDITHEITHHISQTIIEKPLSIPRKFAPHRKSSSKKKNAKLIPKSKKAVFPNI